MKGLQVAPLYFGLAWNPGIPFVRRYGLAISRAEAFEDLCLHDRQWFRQSCNCPRKAFHTKWKLALCRSAPARISKHYPEQRDLFMVRSIAPRSKNIGSTAGTVVTVPSIPHCPVSSAKRSEMACDLSPNVHPAMGRILFSFEPVWLGEATGRGAEPQDSSSAPSRCISEALSFA
jgi:hypothetical protein